MKELLKASKVSGQMLELLSPGPYKIHSRFNNGINLNIEGKLSFIGVGKINFPPLGVLLENGMDKSFTEIHEDYLYWNDRLNGLESKEIFIDFSNAHIIDNRLITNQNVISLENLAIMLEIADINIMTGFGKTVGELSNLKEDFVKDLCSKFNSSNSLDIQRILKKLVGRGIGLTPSGDDFLQGILYINEITPILGDIFVEELKNLIVIDKYTTDISINYYKCAFCQMYSSTLINLYNAIKSVNIIEVRKYIDELLELGNTSGADILSGILTGINFALNASKKY
ncbi:DUF2877 domain-containing protein [Tissierella sp.]|uniref:DUF2877 domain-containing protein n=1 Tax=Tissierella sp. TaxID=41274 RepID=UPI002864C12C|nr:DUF2877 domain-containing protein [Tissierella sp.]MDR7855286.1 DUF2877 domain-containing protein [Tissierella sp.]